MAKFIVNEPSFIDGTLRQAGDIVETNLGGEKYHEKKHANLTPYSPKALQEIQQQLAEEEAKDPAGIATAEQQPQADAQ